MRRQHAAIMFTDMVGYTALMGSDENRAFEILRKNRELHKKCVRKHQGDLVKEMGDGMLISFKLASDAVRCAMTIQQEAVNLRIPLRIGIHEGEMVFEGTDVLGDGVNIASRLQEISEPGVISISGAVYRDVKNKPGIKAKFIDERRLKNVDEPVKIYQILYEEYSEVNAPSKDLTDKKSGNRKGFYFPTALAVILIILLIIWYPYQNKKNRTIERTIAVLPFHDDSPEKDNEYFCNGMMEEILNHLQKIGDLQVKSRTSVEQYRNPMRDIKAIGKELQVAFLVEGSVRKFGDDLRITAQLIETNSGNHLWSEIYDGKYTDEIFDFQSEVAKRIAASLDAAITPEEELSIEKLPTSNIEAYDYYRRANYEGQLYWKTHDFEHLRRSHELLDKALEIDPLYKWAIAQKGDVFISEGLYDSALAYANRVLDIDPKFAWGYGVKGEYYRYTGVSDLAIENYMTAIDYYGSEYMEQGKWYEFLIGTVYCQQKNDYRKGLPYLQNGFDINGEQGGSECHILGMIFSDIGDYERSEKYYRKMLMLEPGGNCIGASFYATVLLFQSKIDEVLDLLDLLCKQHECWWVCNKIKFYTYTTLKEFDEAERSYNQFITDGGIPSRMDSIWLGYLYKQTGRDQKAFTVLTYTRNTLEKQMKSSKYWFLYFNLSSTYALLDAKEKALEYLAESVNIGLKLGFHDFLNMDPVFESYRDDPGFKAILKKAQEDKAATREIIKNMEEQGELDL